MRQLARQRFSFDEYVELEAIATGKHEFLDGEVWAMAGGSPAHAAIAGNLIRLLGQALLGRPCRVFTSDLRIRVRETGLATYPDASVVCGAIELDPDDHRGHSVSNPIVLVEVLSPSTEDYDRGEQLAHYKRIPSLREIVLVAHDEPRVDIWRRLDDRWTLLSFRAGEAVVLDSLTIELPVADVYFDPLA
jgi:Uma2 family endonuclease